MKLVALALVLLAAHAGAAPTFRAQMTGAQLVRDMRADPGIGFNSERRERAMGYIAGVMDSTAGVQWCPAGRMLPHELNYLLIDDIESLEPAKLEQNAAPIILAALAKKYPCNSAGAKR